MDLSLLWSQGDWVTRTVALLLLIMSVASWTVIICKAYAGWRKKASAKQTRAFWKADNIEQGIGTLSVGSPFADLANAANRAVATHKENETVLQGRLGLSDWVERQLSMTLDEHKERLNAWLSILASVGSTAPFVGLFGTVWGIYHALIGISNAGQASIDQVAGPIGEALIMTALGLAVAIPAVLGYNALVRGNKGLVHKMQRFAHDLHNLAISGK